MNKHVVIGNTSVGRGNPCYIIGEIGLNHNGDMKLAKRLIDVAAAAGCNAVKFQKRNPEVSTPPAMRDTMRQTPWGEMTYLEYRYRVEFDAEQYREIDAYCRERGIDWFASPWDCDSVDFLEQFNPVCFKMPSACITNMELLDRVAATGRTVILSSGMSTMEEIERAVARFDRKKLLLMHCTSSYPCPPDELNLRMIQTLSSHFQLPVGYSGHEVGLQTTYAAVALGACSVERHITLDRHMWGSDHAASVEPTGLFRLVRDIRIVERSLGDGQKRVYESEKPMIKRLRG